MPSTRRSTGSTRQSRPANQTKLAFSNRVTKSNLSDPHASAKKATVSSTTSKGSKPALEPEISQIVPDDEEADTSIASVDSAPAPAAPVEVEVDETEIAARKIKESQIKKFYNEQEKARKAPRIHQGDLSINERLLRSWDVDSRYGPCIGIDRTKRWKRAHKFGLNPPIEILAVLLHEQDASGNKLQRAHLDEIMASRFAD